MVQYQLARPTTFAQAHRSQIFARFVPQILTPLFQFIQDRGEEFRDARFLLWIRLGLEGQGCQSLILQTVRKTQFLGDQASTLLQHQRSRNCGKGQPARTKQDVHR